MTGVTEKLFMCQMFYVPFPAPNNVMESSVVAGKRWGWGHLAVDDLDSRACNSLSLSLSSGGL